MLSSIACQREYSQLPSAPAEPETGSDIIGRRCAAFELSFGDDDIVGFPTDPVRHFLESVAAQGRLDN